MKWSGDTYENPPVGTHVARCVAVIDLGTQPVEWQGSTKYQKKARITWELPETKMGDGRPFSVSRRYTASLSPRSKLIEHLTSWRGGKKFSKEELASFDPRQIVGAPCQLTLVESDDGKFVNISAVTALPKGLKVPKQVNPSVFFSLDPGEFDPKVFAQLSEKTREVITHSPEYAALMGGKPDPVDREADTEAAKQKAAEDDDECPF